MYISGVRWSNKINNVQLRFRSGKRAVVFHPRPGMNHFSFCRRTETYRVSLSFPKTHNTRSNEARTTAVTLPGARNGDAGRRHPGTQRPCRELAAALVSVRGVEAPRGASDAPTSARYARQVVGVFTYFTRRTEIVSALIMSLVGCGIPVKYQGCSQCIRV